MAARDKDERAEIASLAAHTRWGQTVDRRSATAAARDALLASFEAPPEVTDPAQRQSMFDHAYQAHLIKMRRAAQRARETRAANRETGNPANGTAA